MGSHTKTIWKAAGVVFAICLAMVLVGCLSGVEAATVTVGGSRTTGRVVAARLPDGRWLAEPSQPAANIHRTTKRRDGGGAVVQFVLDQQIYEITSRKPWIGGQYRLGDQVVVVYQPVKPEDGRVDSFNELWLFPTIGALGLLGVIVGLVLGVFLILRSMSDTEKSSRSKEPR